MTNFKNEYLAMSIHEGQRGAFGRMTHLVNPFDQQEGVIAHQCSIAAGNQKERSMSMADEHDAITRSWNTLDGISILMADDALDNLLIFSTILRAHGAQVDNATNGNEVVDKAFERPYDIILLDLQMPIKDGLTAARELRGKGFAKPILALTAMIEEKAEAIAAGCTDHLSKPVNGEDLIQKILKLARPKTLSR